MRCSFRRRHPRPRRPNTIWLDPGAPGPGSDSDFTTPGDQGEQHRMDLLTLLEHEIGHVLGYEHEESGVMIDTLPAGTPAT